MPFSMGTALTWETGKAAFRGDPLFDYIFYVVCWWWVFFCFLLLLTFSLSKVITNSRLLPDMRTHVCEICFRNCVLIRYSVFWLRQTCPPVSRPVRCARQGCQIDTERQLGYFWQLLAPWNLALAPYYLLGYFLKHWQPLWGWAICIQGRSDGGYIGIIYPPKISLPKIFMGYFFFFLWGRASTGYS